MANQVTIVIGADGNAAITGIKQVGDAVDNLPNKTGKASSGMKSHLETVKTAWLEVYAKVELVKQAMDMAKEYRLMAAQAEQAKETYASVAASFGIDASKMMEDMKRATKGIIDDSDLAQQALRGMMLGLKQDEVVGLMEAARPAARVLGVEYKQAMEMLITAVGGGVRAMGPLVQAGLVSKDMFKLLQQAEQEGIETQGLYNIVVAQGQINMARMSDEALNTYEKMQKMNAQITEIKETIGGWLNEGMARLTSAFQGLAAMILEGYAALKLFGAAVKELWGSGTSEQIAEMRSDALAAQNAAADLYKKSAAVLDDGTAKRIKSGIDVNARQKEIDDYKKSLKELVDAKKNAGKADAEAQAMIEWKKSIDMLDPSIDELTKKLTDLTAQRDKLTQKYGQKDWINQGYSRGQTLINAARIREMDELQAELNAVGKEGMTKDLLDLDKWFSDKIYKYQNNEEAIVQIVESREQQKLLIRRKYAEQERQDMLKVFEAEVALQKQRISIAQDRGYMSSLKGQAYSKDADISANAERQKTLQATIAITEDLEKQKSLKADLRVLETQMLGLVEERKRIEEQLSGTFGEGMLEGIRRYQQSMGTAFEQGRDMVQNITNSMTGAFDDFFNNTSDNFMKFGRLAEQVLNSIAREILKVLILKPLMGAITSGISSIFGGTFGGEADGVTLLGDSWTIGHTGGHVTAAGIIPRYHVGGLAKDEVPAILQTGEYVVSRKGVAALEKLNRGEVAGGGDTTVNIVVNNKTGLPFNLKQTGQQVDDRTRFKTLYFELMHSDPDFKRMR